MERIPHWIGGRPVPSASGRSGPVFDPATGRQTREVGFATAGEVDAAVAAARQAFPAWRAAPLSKRADILFRFRELVSAHRRELAGIVTSEHGKVLADAEGEVGRGLETVEFACGIPHLLKGGFTEQAATGVDVYSIRQPLGVAAGISPFNFPVMVPMWMFAGAIACGNAFVLKPSEKDPGVPMRLAELWREAGLPNGVFNVVQGDRDAAERLLEHPEVRAVSFVGSTPAAKAVYERGAARGKRVQALGGAKNHMIVLPDADLGAAADAAVSAAYGSAGERCMAVSVLVPVGSIADALVDAVRARLGKVTVGPGVDPASEMGPLITREHRDRVAAFLDAAAAEGATVVADGRTHPLAKGPGFFLGLSLVDRVKPGMKVYEEEVFGPVLSVVRAESYADALRLIDRNRFGNGASIFTRDGGAAREFVFDCPAGMVGVNVPIPVPVAYYSFGGWKDSLFGDSHIYGPEGIHFFTRGKVVTERWPAPATSKIDLGFPRTR